MDLFFKIVDLFFRTVDLFFEIVDLSFKIVDLFFKIVDLFFRTVNLEIVDLLFERAVHPNLLNPGLNYITWQYWAGVHLIEVYLLLLYNINIMLVDSKSYCLCKWSYFGKVSTRCKACHMVTFAFVDDVTSGVRMRAYTIRECSRYCECCFKERTHGRLPITAS